LGTIQNLRDKRKRCIYAYTMESIGPAIRSARQSAGLSIRTLAKRAGLAASTVSRIEKGLVDPGVCTIQAILEASGYSLQINIHRSARFKLSSLTNAWGLEHGREAVDWTRIRLFVDYLAAHSDELSNAIHDRPELSGSPSLDALLASIAEKLADDAHQTRPIWTSDVSTLPVPTFFVPTTPLIRKRITNSTPRQFLGRGVMVDAQSIWRSTREADAA
jgi:transcriptional regulator with XRE-family HTH domain